MHVADALIAAISAVPRPHVVLIEVELGVAALPVETDPAVLKAIRLAVGNGVIVVEAGGNGGNDLDSWTDAMGKHRLNRNSADFVDSGAILVGAGTAAYPHERSIWPNGDESNYGSRFDCYAWGDSIVTCGYGNLAGSRNNSYMSRFGGTSGASAIIAGAALLIQGMHLATTQTLLSPLQMRTLLSAPALGTTQGTVVPGHIGVMPNLRAIVEKEMNPRVAKRANDEKISIEL